jgi:hypothetical protein
MTNPAPDRFSTKEALEIEKLRREIKQIAFNRWVQLITPISVLAATAAVLIFFQRPQLETIQVNQLASERHQAATILIAAQSITDVKQRSKIIQALPAIYPQQDWLVVVARSDSDISDASLTQKLAPLIRETDTIRNQVGGQVSDLARYMEVRKAAILVCNELKTQLAHLQSSRNDLQKKLRDEELGLSGRPRGIGPVAKALQAAISEADRPLEEGAHHVATCDKLLATLTK